MALVEALRRGGYVIYFRHARTDYSTPESQQGPEWWKSCDPTVVRNLSDEGRAQARAISEAFRKLQIPVGQVLSSEFCRCLETARLALGDAQTTPDLSSFATTDEAGPEQRVMALRRLLSTPPPAGTNSVLVGHLFNIQAAAGVSLPEGGAAIFEPLGDAGFRLLAVVPAEEWTHLVGTVAAPGPLTTSLSHAATPEALAPRLHPEVAWPAGPDRRHHIAHGGHPRPWPIAIRVSARDFHPPATRCGPAGARAKPCSILRRYRKSPERGARR